MSPTAFQVASSSAKGDPPSAPRRGAPPADDEEGTGAGTADGDSPPPAVGTPLRRSTRRSGGGRSSRAGSQSPSSLERVRLVRAAKQSTSSLGRRRDNDDDGDDPVSGDRTLAKGKAGNGWTAGKRTGVLVPPRGNVAMDPDDPEFEDIDDFFNSARSPSPASSAGAGPAEEGGVRAVAKEEAAREEENRRRRREAKRGAKARAREEEVEEKRQRLRELEERGTKNLRTKPSFARPDERKSDDDGENDDGENATVPPLERTPRLPGWAKRYHARAMRGTAGDESSEETPLSRVSTAPPSTAGTIATVASNGSAAESAVIRHALRREQDQVGVDRIADHVMAESPSATDGSRVQLDDSSSSDSGTNAIAVNSPPRQLDSPSDRKMDPPEVADDDDDNDERGEGQRGQLDPEEGGDGTLSHESQPIDPEEDDLQEGRVVDPEEEGTHDPEEGHPEEEGHSGEGHPEEGHSEEEHDGGEGGSMAVSEEPRADDDRATPPEIGDDNDGDDDEGENDGDGNHSQDGDGRVAPLPRESADDEDSTPTTTPLSPVAFLSPGPPPPTTIESPPLSPPPPPPTTPSPKSGERVMVIGKHRRATMDVAASLLPIAEGDHDSAKKSGSEQRSSEENTPPLEKSLSDLVGIDGGGYSDDGDDGMEGGEGFRFADDGEDGHENVENNGSDQMEDVDFGHDAGGDEGYDDDDNVEVEEEKEKAVTGNDGGEGDDREDVGNDDDQEEEIKANNKFEEEEDSNAGKGDGRDSDGNNVDEERDKNLDSVNDGGEGKSIVDSPAAGLENDAGKETMSPPSGNEREHFDDDATTTSESVRKRNKKLAKKKRRSDARTSATPSSEHSVVTPSVLRKKGRKKNMNASRGVTFSTPTGRSKGYPAGNRDYEAVPVSDFKDDDFDPDGCKTPGGTSIRRSGRARFKPLQFWKNEKLIYGPNSEGGDLGRAMGNMPVVEGVQQALPTPYKARKMPQRRKDKDEKGKTKSKKRSNDDNDSDEDDAVVRTNDRTPFDSKRLRRKYRFKDGESGEVWSETTDKAVEAKIISRLESRNFSKLPLSSSRNKSESKVVGLASQAFNIMTDEKDLFPGYIAGNAILPPGGVKDAEGVGLCAQVFNVGDCQPNSLEFAIADPTISDGEYVPENAQRFLLSKGDMFQIPPGNVYRIENHSRTDDASLFWTIIKSTRKAEEEVS